MAQVFKIETEDPWDSIIIADGDELKVGTKAYHGESNVLINGQETKVADPVWGGTYIIDGKSVEIVDGIITEINHVPSAVEVIKLESKNRKEEYKKR